jgi:hypothetical protein
LVAAKACLVAHNGAGTTLALQAMAHGDAHWFSFNPQVKLTTVASCMAGSHELAPRLSALSVTPTVVRCLPHRRQPLCMTAIEAARLPFWVISVALSVRRERPLLIRSLPNFGTAPSDVTGQSRRFALQKQGTTILRFQRGHLLKLA